MPISQVVRRRGVISIFLVCLSMIAFPALSGEWSSFFLRSGTNFSAVSGLTAGTLTGRRDVVVEANRDFGNFVLGGSIRQGDARGGLRNMPNDVIDIEPNSVQMRLGYDFGRSYGYVAVGSQHDRDGQGGDEIDSFGFGMRWSINRALQVTGEYLHQSTSQVSSRWQRDSDSLALSAAFRF